MALRISREARLMAVIVISGGFFLAEISGIYPFLLSFFLSFFPLRFMYEACGVGFFPAVGVSDEQADED